MKFLTSILIISLVFVFLVNPVYAQSVPTPSISSDQQEASQSASTTKESNGILSYMIDYVTSIDNFLGSGLVFSTPDVFGDTITLPGGGQFNGFGNYRSVFILIAIGIVSMILAVIGVNIALEQQEFQLQPILFRLLLTGALFAVFPFLLGLTIQGTNLLNNQILLLGKQSSTTIDYGKLAVDILTDILKQIEAGASPSTFGIPNVQVSILGNFIQSVALFLFESFVFLLTILFFLLGFLFILFQFVIRFISLLFLSVLYPFVVPFALSSKTQGVVKAYFMAWVSFLIHQPAFILGYMIVLNIFNGLLTRQGASLGMLFLYSGSLFFLAGINSLVTRIFGEPWTAIGTNIQAAVLATGLTGAITNPIGKFKQGMVGGKVNGFTSLAGRGFAKNRGWLSKDGREFNMLGVKEVTQNGEGGTTENNTPNSRGGTSQQKQNRQTSKLFVPSVTQEIQQRNIPIESVNNKTGEVYMKKTPVYAYEHPEKPLVVNYLSKEDAVKDGLRPEQVRKTFIEGKLADYSAFYKTGAKNPYNTYAGKVKKDTNFQGKVHATFTSSEDWMKNHLEHTKDYMDKKEIKGVIGKRNGNYNNTMNKEKVIRIYTLNQNNK